VGLLQQLVDRQQVVAAKVVFSWFESAAELVEEAYLVIGLEVVVLKLEGWGVFLFDCELFCFQYFLFGPFLYLSLPLHFDV